MSLELNVYARSNDPVLRSDMDQALAVVEWEYLLFEDLDSFQLVDGAFVPSCDVIAWDNESGVAKDVNRAVATRDRAALEKLFADDLIGSVEIDLELPFRPDPEMMADLREQGVDHAIMERIAEANLFYSVRTSATRNDLSLELQTMVGSLLGVALSGVLEDPQEGTFDNLAEEIVDHEDDGRPLPTQARKKPWWKFW